MNIEKALAIIFTLALTNCQSQTDEELLEKEVDEKLTEWAENPHFNNEILDPAILEQFQDSGQFVNEMKDGLWIEYSLDTSLYKLGETVEFRVSDKKGSLNLGAVLNKEVGYYKEGNRNGNWTIYQSGSKKQPFYWDKIVSTNYFDGKKHGEEIIYHGSGELKPLIISNWNKGVKQGASKMFDSNYPYNLKTVYYVGDSTSFTLEEYYSNGHLRIKNIDTTGGAVSFIYSSYYLESGELHYSGYWTYEGLKTGEWTTYYKNGQIDFIETYEDDLLNGITSYYHLNGQLWTERVYSNNKIQEVISNFDKNGIPKDAGTIKNGTGSLNLYDAEGNLIKVIQYVNGIEK